MRWIELLNKALLLASNLILLSFLLKNYLLLLLSKDKAKFVNRSYTAEFAPLE